MGRYQIDFSGLTVGDYLAIGSGDTMRVIAALMNYIEGMDELPLEELLASKGAG